MGFHAPEEAARILADSINAVRLGQIALRDLQAGKTVSGPAPIGPRAVPGAAAAVPGVGKASN